jgi:hypothetical protein
MPGNYSLTIMTLQGSKSKPVFLVASYDDLNGSITKAAHAVVKYDGRVVDSSWLMIRD